MLAGAIYPSQEVVGPAPLCRTAKTYSTLHPSRGPQPEKGAFLGPCKPTGRHSRPGVTSGVTTARSVTCRAPWRGGAVLRRSVVVSGLNPGLGMEDEHL